MHFGTNDVPKNYFVFNIEINSLSRIFLDYARSTSCAERGYTFKNSCMHDKKNLHNMAKNAESPDNNSR